MRGSAESGMGSAIAQQAKRWGGNGLDLSLLFFSHFSLGLMFQAFLVPLDEMIPCLCDASGQLGLSRFAQSQYLITPSCPAVATRLVVLTFHSTQVTAPSPARILCIILHVFQSQKQTHPPLSPLVTKLPSGLIPTSVRYPAVLWPRKLFFRFCLNRSPAA